MNIGNNNPVPVKTPSQDAQGRWYELLSTAQVLTEEQNFEDDNKLQKKKKKCRGDRKAQRLRRRERRRQQIINNDTNHMDQDILIIEDDNDDSEKDEQILNYSLNNPDQTRSKNKRKRQDLNKDDTDIHRSFSQLSISQENPKKKKQTLTTDNQSNNQVLTVENGDNHDENEELLSMISIQRLKPRYLKVSDKIFKQMLSKTIQDNDKLVACLDTNEKIQFVRRMTEVTNNLYYLDLQHRLWQDYYNIGIKEGIWAKRLSKSYAKQHNTCRTYAPPKHIIEKRLTTIKYQLECTINELQQYLLKSEQKAQQWQPSFDPNILSNAINECVKKGQKRLRQEFGYKKEMLVLNSNDHHLIKQFYELQPNQEQIRLAKMIWRTTADEFKTNEYEEILRKRISLQRLPNAIDKVINRSIDSIQLLLSNPVIKVDQRASIISSCSKTVTR